MAKVSDYLTIRDAAEYLGVSKDTLRRWDRAKKLVARRNPMSRYRLYSKKDLDDLLATLGRQPQKVTDSNRKGGIRRSKRPWRGSEARH